MVIDIVQKKVEQSKGRRGGSGAGGDAGDGGGQGRSSRYNDQITQRPGREAKHSGCFKERKCINNIEN